MKRNIQVISANAPRTYSKMTRKTSRNVTMKGNKSMEIDSARIRPVSDNEVTLSRRRADSVMTGKMNSSEVTVRRKITPKVANTFQPSSDQTTPLVLGYSNS
jgi:hypothetical protein